MFKQSVSSTMLTSEAANVFFPNITGEMFGSDNTFLATLRALVAPRMPKDESIHLSFGRSDYNATVVSETSVDRMVNAICSNMTKANGRIYVHNLANRDEANNVANIELLKRQFCEVNKGWQYLDKISIFYQKSFKVVCFINPETKSTSLFVEQLNLQKLHYLQMSVLAFLPWYFDTAIGMNETEMSLVYSLRERTAAKYEECIAEIAKQYDFESARIKQMLTEFEIKYEKKERERVQRDIANVDRNIKDLDRRFAEYIKQRNDLCIHLVGLESRIHDGAPSELMEYFLCNRKLYLEGVNDSSMSFAVRDYMSYFDEDAAQTYINNKSSRLYEYCGSNFTKSDMEKLLTAIFIDQVLKIRFCAAYYFDLNGSVSAQYHHSFGQEFNGFKPNPHIDEFECMGNYKRTVNDALHRRDYITALEQCVASAKSLNLHDGAVIGRFMSQFTNNGGGSYKAIELPDGKVVSPKEAVKWLKDQEGAAKPSEESSDRVADIPADEAARVIAAAEAAANAGTEANIPF